MKCPNCGNDNKESSKFCFKCGFKMPISPAPQNIPSSIPNLVNSPSIPNIPSMPNMPKETAPVSPAVLQPHMDLSTRPLISAMLIFKDSGREFNIPYKQTVQIGREDKQSGHNPDIDLTEVDKAKVTSRKHCSILFSNGKYKIADHGSLNGTFLNGGKLDSGKEYDLKDGDEICLGKLACIFSCTV